MTTGPARAQLEDADEEELVLALRRMSKAFGSVSKLADEAELNVNTLIARGRRATQLEVDLSGFPNVQSHFKRMQERPSVISRVRVVVIVIECFSAKKLLAYQKRVQERFAKTAYLAGYRYQFWSSAVAQSWTVESLT